MLENIIVIGYGGHAKVIEDCIKSSQNLNLIGYLDVIDRKNHLKYLGNDNDIREILIKHPNARFIIGIGDLPLRRKLIEHYRSNNAQFARIVHTSAVVSPKAEIGAGTVVFPGAIINSGSRLGEHCIINSGAIVEHDNRLGDNVHFAPRSVSGGQVEVGEDTLIGIGAIIRNNISIGRQAVIACGAVVVKNIPDAVTVRGVPAVEVKGDTHE